MRCILSQILKTEVVKTISEVPEPELSPDRGSLNKESSQILHFYYGEFDPGSERTLAAWIRHASRTDAAMH